MYYYYYDDDDKYYYMLQHSVILALYLSLATRLSILGFVVVWFTMMESKNVYVPTIFQNTHTSWVEDFECVMK